MAASSVTLNQLLSIVPEHEVPAPGDIVDYSYAAGVLPVSVHVKTDAAGVATFTVSASAEEAQYSMEAARKALVRTTGNDPDKPESLGRACAVFGAQAFGENVVYLVKQRLMCLAYMRTGILPFLTAEYSRAEVPVEGRDFTFTAYVRLRPRGTVKDFSPVELAFPAKPEVSEKDVDEFVGQMMGGAIRMDAVPEEAKAGMERLRGQAREACEKKRDNEWWEALMEAAAQKFTDTRLVGEPGVRYVLQLAELMANQFAENVERQGRKWEDFTKEPGFDMEEFKSSMMDAAKVSLRRGLALDCVVAHESMKLQAEDVLACLGPVARGTEAIAAQAMIDNGQLPQLIEVALRAKASDWLAQQAVDTTGK